MAYTRPIVGKVTLKISGLPEDKTDVLEEFLTEAFQKEGTWDFSYGLESDNYPVVAIFTEVGTETVYPGCYYMPNGDPGYPDEYDDDLCIDDYLVDEYFNTFCTRNGLQDVEYLTDYETFNE